MKTTAALVRVSTDHQDPESQRRTIAEFADREGIEIGRWYDEGNVSGALDEKERPVLAELMGAIRAGEIGTLIISEWSRLGRDALTQLSRALEIQRADVRVVALDDRKEYDLDDPDDLLLFFILCWKDHRSRLDTKMRTLNAVDRSDGVTVSRRNRKRWGTPPLKWTDEADAKLLAGVRADFTPEELAAERVISITRPRAVNAEGAFVHEAGGAPVAWSEAEVFPSATTLRARLRALGYNARGQKLEDCKAS